MYCTLYILVWICYIYFYRNVYICTCIPDNMIDLVFNVRCFEEWNKKTFQYKKIRGEIGDVKFVKADINAHKQCQTLVLSAYREKKIVSHPITTFPTGKLNFTKETFLWKEYTFQAFQTIRHTSRKCSIERGQKTFWIYFAFRLPKRLCCFLIRFQDGIKFPIQFMKHFQYIFCSCLSICISVEVGILFSLSLSLSLPPSSTLQVFKLLFFVCCFRMTVAHHSGVSFIKSLQNILYIFFLQSRSSSLFFFSNLFYVHLYLCSLFMYLNIQVILLS